MVKNASKNAMQVKVRPAGLILCGERLRSGSVCIEEDEGLQRCQLVEKSQS